jgi:tetratricopeptide (TPR) repeat protein
VFSFGILTANSCARQSNRSLLAGSLRGWNVLLVTIDTLRADHVGAYGSQLGATPTLDRLAREGLRFERTYAHVPLTLPSHTTIMTGLYPFTNGVRDNGAFRLDPTRPTIARALKAAGYRTGAFVGAFVLDARFGLNNGFDSYDDRMLGTGGGLEVVRRPAEQVLSAAGDWIVNGAGTYFAWVHLYDPHEPYEPPEPYRSRYLSDLYAGEIAYADAALGTFLDRLRGAGALVRTLVVVTSDHGESLGEHGERTHGLFAYDATLRVPLIFWTAPSATTSTRSAFIPASARLIDIMPTVLDLLGVPMPGAVDGRSLHAMIAGDQPATNAPSYFEALNANLTRNWAPLKGIVVDRLKLIDLPIPELYDLASDPNELTNIYASQIERARPLESALDRLVAAPHIPVTPAAVDAEAEARLRSLGYVVRSTERPTHTYTPADDPKRLVYLDMKLDDAMAMWTRRDAQGAIEILRSVIKARPDLTVAYDRLAFILTAIERPAEAVTVLDNAARAGHADSALLRSLGSALRDAGDLARSAAVLEAVVKQDPADLQSLDALGQTYARMRRGRDAEAMFRKVLTASPNAAATWNNLGVLYLGEKRDGDAVEALSRAISIDPALAGAHNSLGVAYARQGNLDSAVGEWREALRIRPDFEDPRANLDRGGARPEEHRTRI